MAKIGSDQSARSAVSSAMKLPRMNLLRKYGYVWLTSAFFALSIVGHWTFGWFAYVNEQQERNQPVAFRDYAIELSRDTLENWQSEFLQLIWQVAGLALLLHVGSPQSKEGDDRKEEKIDAILRLIDPEHAEKICSELELRYPKR